MTACPNCAVDNRPGARFCRNCGVPQDAAPRRRQRHLPPTATLVRIGALAVGLVAVLVVLSLVTGGDDGGSDEIDVGGSPEEEATTIRRPADVSLEIISGTCEDGDSCQTELTYTDRSVNESQYIARFAFREADATRQVDAPLDGAGEEGRIVEVVPVDDPVCVTLRVDGGGEDASAPRLCRMAVLTGSGPRLVEVDGLTKLVDLPAGSCAVVAEGQDPEERGTAWFRNAPCSTAGAVRSFFRESPTQVADGDAANARCAPIAATDPVAYPRYVGVVGEGRDGERSMVCIVP